MLCKDIIHVIEEVYPKHAALEWDHVGLQVGRSLKEVKKIYIALDATDEVIQDAIEKEADMLVTHHPLIFSPLSEITDEDFVGSRVVKLLQHDICYYAMHTNYDVLGMAKLSGEILGLNEMQVFDMTSEEMQEGIGRIGKLPKQMTLKETCEYVKEKLNLDNVKVYGDLAKPIASVAISPGSGKGMTGVALKEGVDVLITGDIGYHEGVDAVNQGLALIDAGHYGTEYIFIDDMKTFFETKLEEMEIATATIKSPFQIV